MVKVDILVHYVERREVLYCVVAVKDLTEEMRPCAFFTIFLSQVFIGSIGRFEVTRHWFKEVIYAQYVRIKPASSNSVAGVCMRVQVLGCPAEITRGIKIRSLFSHDNFP